MISRIDDQTRWSRHPDATQRCEEEAEERSRPSDEGDHYGWAATVRENSESYWRTA